MDWDISDKIEVLKILAQWQCYGDSDALDEIEDYLTKEVVKFFSEDIDMYRGMILFQEACDNDRCSWTTDYDIAYKFATTETIVNSLLDEHESIRCVVYKKQSTGLNLAKMFNYLIEWAKNNRKIFESIVDVELDRIESDYYDEKEILSDFKLEECEIVYDKTINSIHSMSLF